MKLGGVDQAKLSIELTEEELAIIIEGLEVVGTPKLMYDLDLIVFDYHRKVYEKTRKPFLNEYRETN